MLELTSLLLGAGLLFAIPPAEFESSEQPLRIAAPAPEAQPQPAPAPEPAPIEFAQPPPEAEPEAPIAVEPPPPSFDSAPALSPAPLMVDSKRPGPGTGRIALGSVSVAASSVLAITALAGPGWLDLGRRESIIAGGVAVPLAVAGFGLIVSGTKSARRYQDWSARNQLDPPESGNGMLVLGAVTTLGFVSATALGTQWALTNPDSSRGTWAPAIVSGTASVIGMGILVGGMLRRSKYATWERSAYVMPGPMALEHGGGVAVVGRF